MPRCSDNRRPSLAAMPALSCPRCCSACRPRYVRLAASGWPKTPKTPHICQGDHYTIAAASAGVFGHGSARSLARWLTRPKRTSVLSASCRQSCARHLARRTAPPEMTRRVPKKRKASPERAGYFYVQMQALDELVARWRKNPDSESTLALCAHLGRSLLSVLLCVVGFSAVVWLCVFAVVL